MSYSGFRDTVMTGFNSGFAAVRPSFDTSNIFWGRTAKPQVDSESYIRAVFADLEGEFFAFGRTIEQKTLFTVDVYVPEVVDLNEVESICEDVTEVIKFLVLTHNGRKSRLGKRDFSNSLGGYAHSRVSVTFTYDV